nr:PREDICTED: uncharacterized protein LOC109636803 isoform X1 [Paralichthys olivaceus]
MDNEEDGEHFNENQPLNFIRNLPEFQENIHVLLQHLQNGGINSDVYNLREEGLGNIHGDYNNNDENVDNNDRGAEDAGVQVYQGVEDQVYQGVEDQVYQGVEDRVYQGVENQVDQGVEEDDPLPRWFSEEDGQDIHKRSSKHVRWWDESDDSSSDSSSTENDQSSDENRSPVKCASAETEDPLPGPSRRRSCDNDTDRTGRDLAHRSTSAADLAEKAAFMESIESDDPQLEEGGKLPGPPKKTYRKRSRMISRKRVKKRVKKKVNETKRNTDKSSKKLRWWGEFDISILDFYSDDHNTGETKRNASDETEVVEKDLQTIQIRNEDSD